MDYLARETSPISTQLWQQIDAAVVSVARNVLTGRRVLHLVGPLGPGADSVAVDDADARAETAVDGIVTTKGRKLLQLPALYEDFTLYTRDLMQSEKNGTPADLSAVVAAAQAIALKEDSFLFYGHAKLGYDGLLTATGVNKQKKTDWSVGENAFADVAAAIDTLVSKGVFGAYTLVVSPNLYLQMQRLQQALGMMEIDRVNKLVDGRLFKSPVLGKDQAILLCAQPENVDLVVGQDLAAAYLEQRELNHAFRLTETVLARIKKPKAIVAVGA
jgi:uncharacterized linocin/CFP29 family protein